MAAYCDGKWEDAIGLLNSIRFESLSRKKRFRLLEKLALSHCHLGNYKTARLTFERILAGRFSASQKQLTKGNIGSCFFNDGDFTSAERVFREVIEQGGYHAACSHYGMACLHAHQSQHDLALQQFEAAIRLNSDLRENAKTDKDLDAIRPYVRFDEIMEIEDKVSTTTNRIIECLKGVSWWSFDKFIKTSRFAARISPGWVRSAIVVLGRKLLMQFVSQHAVVHGMNTRLMNPCEIDADFMAQLDEALALIQRNSPRQYARFQKDIRSILIAPMIDAMGKYVHSERECQLCVRAFADSTQDHNQAIRELAVILIHEGCHARVRSTLRNPISDPTFREEKLCRLEEQRFVRRAKSDPVCPWPTNYDEAFHHRFGAWNQWYYQDGNSLGQDVSTIRRFVEEGDSGLWEAFSNTVFSSAEKFASFTNDWDTSVASDSQDSTAWVDRGSLRYETHQYADALADFQRAVQLDPTNTSAHNWLARTASALGQFDIALPAWQKVLESNPDCQSSLEWLIFCQLRSTKHVHQTLESTERLLDAQPFCHRALIKRARALAANQQLEAALEVIQKVIVYHPTCREGLPVAHRIATRLERPELAQQYWNSYAEAIDGTISDLQEPVETQAVVLGSVQDQENIRLRILYPSSFNETAIDQRVTLAVARNLFSKLQQATTESDRKFLHTFAALSPYCQDLLQLPASLSQPRKFACQSHAYRHFTVTSIQVPLHNFASTKLPALLDRLPICVDRSDNDVVIFPIVNDFVGNCH